MAITLIIIQDSKVQTDSVPHRWAEAWSSPDPYTSWLALYAPTATYTDHAFFIRRTGIPILKRHINIWRTSIPDFTMEIERVYDNLKAPDGKRRCSTRTINRGTFLHDLVSKKASGKNFSFRGVVDFVIDEESGLIEEVNEWYSWKFDESTDVSEYDTLEDFGT